MHDHAHLVVPTPAGYAPTSVDEVGVFPHDWLAYRARTSPDRIAVTQCGTDWTFAELHQRSLAYASAVAACAGTEGRCVAVVAGSTIEMLAAQFGVNRAGAISVPVDTVDGAQRITTVLDDVEPALVLSEQSAMELCGRWAHGAVAFEDVGAAAPPAPPQLTMAHAARVIFTSGSTGRPKGHVQTYTVLVDWMRETLVFDNTFAGDRIGNPTSLAAAASSSQVLGSIFVGAHLHQFDVHREGVESITRWIGRSRLTWIKSTPALLRNVLRFDPDPAPFRDMRVVRLTGDRILPSDLELILSVLPQECRVAMHYGATEAGPVARLVWQPGVPVPDGRLTVGFALPGRRVRVVGEDGVALTAGRIGLLEVAKNGPVARAYDGADSLRPADEPVGEPVVFGDLARLLPDGQIDIVGRSNARVKIHGRAVDLVEIEQAVRSVPGVATAAVVLEPDSTRPRLVAHVVTTGDGLTAAEVLDGCRPQLAAYMMPSLVRFWDELPTTTRGKLDRQVLTAASVGLDSAGDAVAAGDDLEDELLDIWREVLGVRGIGVTDRFFDVGGDSLRAYEVVVAIEERLGAGVATATLLTAPTVRDQAALIRAGQSRPHAVLVPLRATGDGPAVCFVHGLGGSALTGLQLVAEIAAQRPVWGLHLDSPERAEAFESIGELADAYVAEVVENRLRGPLALIGWSLGGMIVWEMAQRLPAAGIELERLVILDTAVAERWPVDEPRGAAARWSYRIRRNAKQIPWKGGEALRQPRRAARAIARRVNTNAAPRPGSVMRIEAALAGLARGWVPSAASFAVDVVASEGRASHHRHVWPAATSGPLTVTVVRSAYHLDLMTSHAPQTARVIGDLVQKP